MRKRINQMNIAKQPSHEQGGAQSSTSVSSDKGP